MEKGMLMAGQACEPVRETEVQLQLSHLDDAVQELDTQLRVLLDRLHPVSREPYPQDDICKNEAEKVLVPVAGTIYFRTDEIRKLINAINDAADRLEI